MSEKRSRWHWNNSQNLYLPGKKFNLNFNKTVLQQIKDERKIQNSKKRVKYVNMLNVLNMLMYKTLHYPAMKATLYEEYQSSGNKG